jgi:alanyl-tRNA synthetase
VAGRSASASQRIQRLGAKDNFWSMGDTGPCGPCTEIHYDHGPAVSIPTTAAPAAVDDRYVEIWNLVFMQFEQARRRHAAPPSPARRSTPAWAWSARRGQAGASTATTTPTCSSRIIAPAEALANVRYGADAESDTALRVLADHARATAFLVADGVMPSNEGRGYVLRRIMRRAHPLRREARPGSSPFLHSHVTDRCRADFGDAYPELAGAQRRSSRRWCTARRSGSAGPWTAA